jgi:hypothetical protein
MGMTERLARTLASKISIDDILKHIQVSIDDEVVKMVKALSKDRIDAAVEEYLTSPTFKLLYTQNLQMGIQQAVQALLPPEDAILVLEGKEFDAYQQSHTLNGPLVTEMGHGIHYDLSAAYVLAIDELKTLAKSKGCSVIKITNVLQGGGDKMKIDKDIEHQCDYNYAITGNFYR